MAVVCMSAKAQATELKVIGYWEAVETYGYWDAPISVWFKKDGTCTYTNPSGSIECNGYIITDGGSSQILHLISPRDFQGRSQFTMVNIKIGLGAPINGKYSLSFAPFGSPIQTTEYVIMEKKEEPSSVRAIDTDKTATDSTKYNLNGMAVENPQGLYIQSGKKKMAK